MDVKGTKVDASAHQPVFLRTHAGARNLKETVWTVICADFDSDTAVTSNGVAFFTEKEGMERMKAI